MSVSRASGERVARYSFHAASTASGRTAFPADWNGQRDAVREPELADSRLANPARWPLTLVVLMLATFLPMTSGASLFVQRPLTSMGTARTIARSSSDGGRADRGDVGEVDGDGARWLAIVGTLIRRVAL